MNTAAAVTVADIQRWLKSLAQDDYPEDVIHEGDPDQPVRRVLVCFFANKAARRAAVAFGADLIVMHEAHLFEQANHDPGCPRADAWRVNRETRAFFDEHPIALIRCHRTLDAYCIPRDFGDALGLPEPVVRSGHKGYEFTLVYDIEPTAFADLAERFKAKLNLPMARVSAGDPRQTITRIGCGWGGVSQSSNLQYMELLREHGAQAIFGGEVDEYAMEYYRDSGLRWIELGHYASEIIGLRRVAKDMQQRFAGVEVTCFEDERRIAFV